MPFNEVIYQIYPFGFCGAPFRNDGRTVSRIRKVMDWIPYLKQNGFTAVLFNPVFESDSHGYDVRDYSRIDCRLGTNDDFADVCDALHDAGIKVILDISYNHAGHGFFCFQDVLKNKQNSVYRDWFHIDFNQPGRDGFVYENWQGHGGLVKLNLQNPSVVRYLMGRTDQWIAEFSIDGIRIDVAYMLDRDFMRNLSDHIHSYVPGFLLIGEDTGGDYLSLLEDCHLDTVTNYAFRNALLDAFRTGNLNPAADCLRYQYANDFPSVFRERQLLHFADNHDVNRIASEVSVSSLKLLYALLYASPGIPCIYYGSEWGEKGKRGAFTDKPLRPSFKAPKPDKLTDYIAQLSHMHTVYSVFSEGDFKILHQDEKHLVFRRRNHRGQLTFALNLSEYPAVLHTDTEVGEAIDLIRKKKITFSGDLRLAAKEAYFWYTDWL